MKLEVNSEGVRLDTFIASNSDYLEVEYLNS